MIPENVSGIRKAVNLAGGVPRLAEKLGVSKVAIYVWLRAGWVPALRAVEIETQYGVNRRELVSPRLLHLVDVPTDADL